MLGLQTSHDIQNIQRLSSMASSSSGTGQGRSYKFAKHLSAAGFSVAGQTNSMERHSHTQRDKRDIASERKVNLNSKLAVDQFVQKMDETTEEDTQRLAELEAQLAEIKRKKEHKRQRDRERRRRRREFMAACIIQRSIKYYVKTKLAECALQIRKFIILVKNRNTLTVAAWAARTIAAWALKITTRWHAERMRRLAMEMATRLKLEKEQAHAALVKSARNNMSKGVVMSTLKTCMVKVAKQEITARREASRAAAKGKRGWKKPKNSNGSGSGSGSVKTLSTNTKSKSSPGKSGSDSDRDSTFNLTSTGHAEEEDDDAGEEDGPATHDTTQGMIDQSRRQFGVVNASNVPHRPIPSEYCDSINATVTDANGFDFDLLSGDAFSADLNDGYDEEAELEAERKAQVLAAHQEREASMNRERELRLKMLAKKKLQRSEELMRRREEERREKEERDNSRMEWLEAQEDQTQARAQWFTKKRKQAEKDAKKAQKEISLMREEDHRTIAKIAARKALETFIPRRPPKRRPRTPREKSEYELEAEELERIEEEERAEKAAKDLADSRQEALIKRLHEIKDAEEKSAIEAAEKEKLKAEKILAVEKARKDALVKAVEAKKAADAHRKQLKKEMKAMDSADKVGASQGRTHNAFGKPLGVKGFIRDKVDSRGKLKRPTKGGSYEVDVNNPDVIAWNYKIQPSDHSPDDSSKVGNSKDNSPNSLASFKIDEFLLDAKPFAVNNNSVFEHDSENGSFGGAVDEEYWPFGEESNNENDILAAMQGLHNGDRPRPPPTTDTDGSTCTPAKATTTTDASSADSKTSKIFTASYAHDGKENAGESAGVGGSSGTKRSGKKSKKLNALLDKNTTVHGNAANKALGVPQGPVPLVPDKKMSISEITGTSHIRHNNLKIPVGLKDTPYFKSYAKIKEQAIQERNLHKKDAVGSISAPAFHQINPNASDHHASFLLDKIEINVPAPLVHGLHSDKDEVDSVRIGSSSGSVLFNNQLPTDSPSIGGTDHFSFFGELRSPLDLARPSEHPLLAAQTRALHSKVLMPKTKNAPSANVSMNGKPKSQHQQQHQQQQHQHQHQQKPKAEARRRTPPGKVATLHEMIAQARTVLGHNSVITSIDVIQANVDQTRPALLTSDGHLPAFVPPPSDFDIEIDVAISKEAKQKQARKAEEEGRLSGTLSDYLFAIRLDDSAQDGSSGISPSMFEAAKHDSDHFPLPVPLPAQNSIGAGNSLVRFSQYDNDDDDDDDDDDDAQREFEDAEEFASRQEEKRHEAALNAECDMLRLRLTEKLENAHAESMQKKLPVQGQGQGHGQEQTQDARGMKASVSVSAGVNVAPAPTQSQPQAAVNAAVVPLSLSANPSASAAPVAPPLVSVHGPAPVYAPLRAKDIIMSQHFMPRAPAGRGTGGGYSIGIDMPDFSLNDASMQMLQQWAQEDEDGSPSPQKSQQPH